MDIVSNYLEIFICTYLLEQVSDHIRGVSGQWLTCLVSVQPQMGTPARSSAAIMEMEGEIFRARGWGSIRVKQCLLDMTAALTNSQRLWFPTQDKPVNILAWERVHESLHKTVDLWAVNGLWGRESVFFKGVAPDRSIVVPSRWPHTQQDIASTN